VIESKLHHIGHRMVPYSARFCFITIGNLRWPSPQELVFNKGPYVKVKKRYFLPTTQ
jgi:hypothetical protein